MGRLGPGRDIDLYGETVHLALEAAGHGQPGAIYASESAYWRLRQTYEFAERGEVAVHGEHSIRTYILTGRRIPAPQVPDIPVRLGERPKLRSVS